MLLDGVDLESVKRRKRYRRPSGRRSVTVPCHFFPNYFRFLAMKLGRLMRLRGMSTDAISELLLRNRRASAIDPSALPDDPAVLKQMIAELLRACAASAVIAKRSQRGSMPCCDVIISPKPADPTSRPCFRCPPTQVPEPPPPTPPVRRDRRAARQDQPAHGPRRPARELRHERAATN